MRKKREDGHAIHHRRFEQESPAAGRSKIAQLAVRVNDRAFVGADGMRSVFERGADVIDRRQTGFDIKRRGFEEHVPTSRGKPRLCLFVGGCGPRGLKPAFLRWLFGTAQAAPFQIQTVGIGDPAQASRGDSGDAELNAVALAQFLGAVLEQPDQRPVDVAEAEEAEVVGTDEILTRPSDSYPIAVVCSGLIL